MAEHTHREGDHILAAIGLRLGSVVCFAVMAALVKLAEQRGAGAFEILFFRQAIGVPLVTGVIAAGPGLRTVRTNRIGAHVVRASFGLAAMACLFFALTYLPLAEATTLQFTVPIFATILGALVLGERTGWGRWAAVTAGFAGVLIVAQPGAGHFPLWGAMFGLGNAMLTGITSIQLRRMGTTERTETIVFWFACLSLVPLSLIFAVSCRAHPPFVWLLMIGVGLVGTLGQLALTGALKRGPVSVVVPMDYSNLIWATLFGWLLFGVLPGASTLLGAPIIIGSGLFIVWREHKRHQQATAQPVALVQDD